MCVDFCDEDGTVLGTGDHHGEIVGDFELGDGFVVELDLGEGFCEFHAVSERPLVAADFTQ